MKVLVFAKQIPDINQISFDPETNRINRENVPLLINSFDKKAVEEAIRIKESQGWETAVATMGPPQAGEMLNECLRMGIDKAYLVTDRDFAGSDTLVTSRILASVVQHLKPDLVLMGKYSLDGETSQVPPEVAVLSGYSFKSSISRISLDEGGKSLTAEHENEHGLTDYRIPLPAVISVSEKINRARAVKEDVPQMHDRIENLDAGSLGVDIQGSRDSPTVVTGTEKVESGRKVEFIEPGDDLYPRIMEILRSRGESTHLAKPVSPGEFLKGGKAIMGAALGDARVSMEIASRISHIAQEEGLNVIMAGNIAPEALKGMSCHKYYHIAAGESDVAATALSGIMDEVKPEYVILPSTTEGREVAGMIAAEKSLGLTADCIDIAVKDGRLVQYKPAFGGGIVASIISKTSPAMATVRPGMFRYGESSTDFEVVERDPGVESRIERLEFRPVASDFKPLNDSSTVIGVGRGLKSRNNLKPVMDLASGLSASVGGTRPVVDMRWMPRQQQIGLTGISISPANYIALGVSGQDNHAVGIRYAECVIAVNTDREAPVFRYADYGIVADANEFVAGFLEYLKK